MAELVNAESSHCIIDNWLAHRFIAKFDILLTSGQRQWWGDGVSFVFRLLTGRKMPEMSAAEKEFLLRKHEQTMKLRAEFLKQVTNPHRHALGEGGTVFDTGLARFQAMRVSHYDHFKPTGRSFRIGMSLVVLPIVLYGWAMNAERQRREQRYRNGEVAYKDRRFKFI